MAVGSRPLKRGARYAGLGGLVALAVVASLAIGSNSSSPSEVWQALTNPQGTDADIIVRTMRGPRTVLGLVVGACLGAAGVLMQGHTRNALAEPGILGVSAGAAFSVVLGLRTGLIDGLLGSVVAALVGAAVVSLAVFGLARSTVREGGAHLVVAGAAVTALLTAVTSGIVLLDAQTLDAYRFWAVGSLAGRGTGVVTVVVPFAIAGAVLALANARSLDLLSLGPDIAASMGVSVRRSRFIGLTSVAALTATAVAACGPIAFVGLLAGHLARALTGPRWLAAVLMGAVTGALVLLTADVLGRVVAGSGELQVGVVSGLLGGPLLVWVIRHRKVAL